MLSDKALDKLNKENPKPRRLKIWEDLENVKKVYIPTYYAFREDANKVDPNERGERVLARSRNQKTQYR